ncbi:MAG: SDR family oxidoreductase [Flavipsychrobacter sp.]|jgi:NAD(P)-dependent dehydrogenase (short-subunit alcohol dehydrogenase family)|nr:SDR family oxidoreductase [Flavipsychrobacter sp.]
MKNKVVIITGGSKGIGAATVSAFQQAGANVVVLDLEKSNKWEHEPDFYACDVTNESSIKEAIKNIYEKWNRIDILINNAGIQRYGSVTETDSEVWDEVMNVNLKSMFLCSKAVLPIMQQLGAGVIINVSSVQAFHSQQRVAAYTTSKTAILGLTRSIAVDYAPAIRCMAVCPGTVDTPMLRDALALSPNPDAMLQECEHMHLSQRIAVPNEIASLILYLCDDKASFMTGQSIRIDGGLGIVLPGTVKNSG